MKLSRGVFVVMALIAIVVLFSIALLRRPIDPLFEGKYASQWCEELLNSDYSIREAAKSSLQSLGERSVPQLRVLLNHRNGPWEKPLVQLSAVIPGFNFRIWMQQRAELQLRKCFWPWGQIRFWPAGI